MSALPQAVSLADLFATLTPAQCAVLDAGGWTIGSGKRPARNTTKRLVAIGLLVEKHRRFMNLMVAEWFAPVEVAEAWTTWKVNLTAVEAA